MKLCTKCGRKWPMDGNFCPIDGCELITLPDEEAPAENAADAAASADPGAAVDETLGDVGRKKGSEQPAPKPKSAKGNKREFSETQWFMLGADPESLVEDADNDDLQNLQEKYGRDSTIPTNERKKYTLRSQVKSSEEKD